jgi:hypothetical protein
LCHTKFYLATNITQMLGMFLEIDPDLIAWTIYDEHIPFQSKCVNLWFNRSAIQRLEILPYRFVLIFYWSICIYSWASLFVVDTSNILDREHWIRRWKDTFWPFRQILQMWMSEFVDEKTADNEVHLYFKMFTQASTFTLLG